MQQDLSRLKIALDNAEQDSRHWNIVCDEIASVFNANASMLMTPVPEKRGPWLTISSNMFCALEEYIKEGWQLKDHRQHITNIVLERGYASDDDLPESREERAKMPYFRFLSKYGIDFAIGFRVLTPLGYWIVVVYFDRDRPEVTRNEIDLMNTVRPMIEHATARADQIAHSRIADFARFFEGTNTEITVLDALGNHCMHLSENGRWENGNQVPDYLNYQVTNEIKQGIAEVCSSSPELSMSLSFQYTQDGSLHNLLAIQVPPPLRHYYMPFKTCLIKTEIETSSAHKVECLRSKFDLLDSEITTLQLLSAGNNVKSISQLLSLKETTVRQRLKQMYEKTSVSGQVELIALYNHL